MMTLQDYLDQVDAAYGTLTGKALESRIAELCDAARAAFGEESGEHASMLGELGAYYRGQRRLQEAEGCCVKALDLLERSAGRASAACATARNNLAGVHRLMGRYEQAEEEFLDCLDLYRRTVGERDILYAGGLNNYSLLCLDRRDYDKALALQAQAAEILRDLPGCRDELASSLGNQGMLLQFLGCLPEAEERLTQAVRMYETELGTDTPHYHAVLDGLGAVYLQAGDHRRAIEQFEKAAGAAEALYGPRHPEYLAIRQRLEGARRAAEREEGTT